MCNSPNTLADGTRTECHKCWQCYERSINDWVGRNIAESKTSTACHAVTLTYGRNSANDVDHERAAILTYSDVQKYLKLLRRHGYPVRYFVTGEFGSKKGRAHWHIMLYWQEGVPPHVLDRNFMEEHWPHGWSFWTEPTPHAVRYNCKYIQKDMGDDARQGHLAMSKKPPLGTAYFRQIAERHVQQGLAPQTLGYTFPDVRRRKQNGATEIVPFVLKDRPAEMYLQHWVETWNRERFTQDYPKSPLLDEFFDETQRERRKILEWFQELPPNLTGAHRLQIDKYRERLKQLDLPDTGNLPSVDWSFFQAEKRIEGALAMLPPDEIALALAHWVQLVEAEEKRRLRNRSKL